MSKLSKIYRLKWINQESFVNHMRRLTEIHQNESEFETEFCLKFSSGNECNCKFIFNDKDGYFFIK